MAKALTSKDMNEKFQRVLREQYERLRFHKQRKDQEMVYRCGWKLFGILTFARELGLIDYDQESDMKEQVKKAMLSDPDCADEAC